MTLLDEETLERSSVVANSRMNRERGAAGVNSYERELGFDPIEHLRTRLTTGGSLAWLDLCCGRGRALIEASNSLLDYRGRTVFDGVDLVNMFDSLGGNTDVRLMAASLRAWRAERTYDLITCVHGLHYVGDKLGLIQRALTWLHAEGKFAAHLDPANLRFADGKPMHRVLLKALRQRGLEFDARNHRIVSGPDVFESSAANALAGFRFVGADDTAGPNVSGQEAVDSYYERR